MKSVLLLVITSLGFLTLCLAQNVAMSSSSAGVAVATAASSGGLLTRLGEEESLLFPPPDGISTFTDVSIDADKDGLVFGLSVSPPQVCSYSLDQTGSLTLINCSAASFATSPFCGISAVGGTLTISGGTGGVTVFDYDADTGTLEETPRLLNFRMDVIGNPDVLMITPTQAAFSSDIGDSPRFGTIVAEISSDAITTRAVIRNPNSSGFDNTITPSNFPFVNAVYSGTWLYTANGGMSRANLSLASRESTGIEISSPDASFQAVTVAVNEEQDKLVFGGLLGNGQSVIYSFDIMDPENPVLSETMEVDGRITSVASSGSVVAYVVQGGVTIASFAIDEMTPITPTDSTPTSPTMAPTVPSSTVPTDGTSTSSGTTVGTRIGVTILMLTFVATVGFL